MNETQHNTKSEMFTLTQPIVLYVLLRMSDYNGECCTQELLA